MYHAIIMDLESLLKDLSEGEQEPSNIPYNEDIPKDVEDSTGV